MVLPILRFVLSPSFRKKKVLETQFEKQTNKHSSVYISACVPQAQQTCGVHFLAHKTFAKPVLF